MPRSRGRYVAALPVHASLRPTGITVFRQNGGTVEEAQHIANHASPKTTMLYDRSRDQITLDEVERIII